MRSVVVLALALLGAPAFGQQEALPKARLDAIEETLATFQTARGIPGLSAAVVLDGRVVWAGGRGLADVENEVPARSETVYRLASLSKPITATAVLQLAAKGQVDLDASIQRYVPAFPAHPGRVTVRLLLGHLAGIRHYKDGEFESTRHYDRLADALAIFAHDPLVQPPGTAFLYSTYGYTLLGCLVENVSGLAFEEYLSRNIFAPAGMASARLDDVRAIIPHRAQGYARTDSGELRNSTLADTSNKAPGGGLVASAPDVARFAAALVDGTLLPAASLEQMLAVQHSVDGKPTGYGLGLNVSELADGAREAWHTGAQQRVSNVLYLRPDRRLAVVVLMNLESVPERVELARRLAAAVSR